MTCGGRRAIGFEGAELCWTRAHTSRPEEGGVAESAWNGNCRVAAEILQDGTSTPTAVRSAHHRACKTACQLKSCNDCGCGRGRCWCWPKLAREQGAPQMSMLRICKARKLGISITHLRSLSRSRSIAMTCLGRYVERRGGGVASKVVGRFDAPAIV